MKPIKKKPYGKKKEPKKYFLGGALGIATLGAGLAKTGLGIAQSVQAKKEAERLAKERPRFAVPSELRELEQDQAQIMNQAMAENARSRSEALRAAQMGGGRALAGLAPQISEQARLDNLQSGVQMGQMAGQRAGMIADSDMRRQAMEGDLYGRQVAATQAQRQAGTQNAFGGLTDMGRSFLFGSLNESMDGGGTQTGPGGRYDMSGFNYGAMGGKIVPGYAQGGKMSMAMGGQMSPGMGAPMAAQGAPMETPGQYDHGSNPMDVMAPNGEKVAEVTGSETIIAEPDMEMIENLIADGDKEMLFSFVKSLVDKYEQDEEASKNEMA